MLHTYFRKFILALAYIHATAVSAEAVDGSLASKHIDLNVQTILTTAETNLRLLGSLYARDGVGALEASVPTVLPKLPAVRAVIVLDSDGTLIYVSFQSPATKLNLSTREYFLSAKVGPGLFVGSPVRGKTSGVPFVPVSVGIWDDDTFHGAAVAVINPAKLARPEGFDHCANCFSAVIKSSGVMLSVYPPGTEISDSYLDSLQLPNQASKGARKVPYNLHSARTNWIRNQQHPVISIFSVVEPN